MNHEDCEAGTDTRRRLYITRPAGSPEVVLGFCHNCQQHGVIKEGGYRDFHERGVTVAVPPDGKWELPPNLELDPTLWPTDAGIWRMQKNLSEADVKQLGIGYDPASGMVCLPIWQHIDYLNSPDPDSYCFGYQLRNVHGTGPKYLTALKDRSETPFTRFNPQPRAMCVLVEDLASAIAVNKAGVGEWAVVCNYGIKIRPEILAANANCEEYVVWLDNDDDFVKDQAQTIGRTWALIAGQSVWVETEHGDPKAVGSADLRQTVTRWIR